MKVTLPYFAPVPSETPGAVVQSCRVDTDAGPVEGWAYIDARALDAYVTGRAIENLRAFGDRTTIRELGALPDDGALRAFLGLGVRT